MRMLSCQDHVGFMLNLYTAGDVTDSLFSVDETGASAGDIRILSAADRETISSYGISVRVGITYVQIIL